MTTLNFKSIDGVKETKARRVAAMIKTKDLEPKVTELGLTVRRTFNLGNYESLSIEANAACSLEAHTIEEATQKMLPHIRKVLQRAYDDYVDNKGRAKPL